MNFNEYAAANYHNLSELNLPTSFANASKMNTVAGDDVNSLVSPLRAEFYTEAGMFVGGLVELAEIATNGFHDTLSNPVNVGVAAVLGLAAVVRHRAHAAVRSAQ